jgi:hypothetical protein
LLTQDRQFKQRTKQRNKKRDYMQTGSLARQLIVQALGVLIICTSVSLPAWAQDDNANPGPSISPEGPDPQGSGTRKLKNANPDKMKQRRLARLEKIVQLTPDQETKVTPIISDFVDKLVALKSDGSLQPDERKAKQKELRKQYSQQVWSILTPQQRQALKNAKAQRGKGRNQNEGQTEDEKFDQGSNQPNSGI